jgi:predicted nucleic acid-binding protein
MVDLLLVDTDILIDYLRGRAEAVTYLEGLTGILFVSAISVAELDAGVREGAERTKLDVFLTAFEVVPVDAEIAQRGGLYRRDYGKTHNVGLPDALIAATVETRKARLVTLNQKHFPMLTDVIIPYHKV